MKFSQVTKVARTIPVPKLLRKYLNSKLRILVSTVKAKNILWFPIWHLVDSVGRQE